ncbi:AMP-dependent synthetase/ligase [Candidatus Pelagibacter sp. RS40]|uniref:AMP-dependent synthetase/ligase n=1 Tax=Candidatus Pelagibacter sp. RS40 TaxID=1977865 RepID=UPI000A1689A1|nr:long-chain fatty acid--CoA ligase [Candidatus Pelagibacter sp. RS40]ARJ49126.1 long-chain fatty acid--CoA ligase [Candidatus Pelagibacter sp. RS40]
MKVSEINNLLELFFERYKLQDKNSVFLTPLNNNQKSFTWEETKNNILKLSKEISDINQKGDRCLLISENRPEWMISDLSIMLSGSITVPAYTTYVEKDYEYIINDCQPKVLIVSNQDQFSKIENILKNNTSIKKIISFEDLKIDKDKYLNFKNLNLGNNVSNSPPSKIDITRKDPACIIYTSGTQGNPKGVILSHGGVLNNCEGAMEILEPIVSKNSRFLTWLPLSHSYEHAVQFVQICVGAKVFYAESIEKLIKNMNDCKPHIMTAVPRFYQNLYQKINSAFNKATGLKKKLISKMLQIGKKKINKQPLSLMDNFFDFILETVVRRKIKSQFGGNLKAFVSGGGPLDKDVGIFLNAIGLPTLQGYGLTETSPVVSCNPFHDIRVETVGPPFRGNEVKIAQDGEILVKGENVMLGYWNNKEETDKVLKDGWLHTGDIGLLENDYLKITDRKKDILVTPGGDNISPLKIENELVNSELIDQAIVYGDNKPYLVSMLVLSEEKKNINEEEIQKEIEKINKNLTKVEKIKKFFISEEKFSIENGMQTPTMKLKRYKIIKKFKNKFESLY